MNNIMSGITALDPRIAATDKFIKDKNIPPDQVENFLLSNGVDPRTVALLFKYRKVQEAANNQSQPPTSTVADDVTQQYAQMRQQRGLASMPAPAMANAAMQGGITGEPEQRMAGGGVVALAGGSIIGKVGSKLWKNKGTVAAVGAGAAAARAMSGDDEDADTSGVKVEEESEDLSPEDYKVLAGIPSDTAGATTPKLTAPAMTKLPPPPKYIEPDLSQRKKAIEEAEKRMPASREAAYQEQMAREEKLGQHKVFEDRLATLANQEKDAKMDPRQRFWMSFAQAGFAASAKGARNLAEALAYGGEAGIKAYQTMKDKEEETLEKIADKKLELQNMQIAIKRGAMDKGDKEYEERLKDLQTLRNQYADQQLIITNARNSEVGRQWEAQFGDISRKNAAAMQIGAANARTNLTMAAQQQRMKLDQAIDDAILQSTNPRLTQEQRDVFKKKATILINQRAAKERTESGFQSAEAKLAAQNAMLGGGNDGFGDISVE